MNSPRWNICDDDLQQPVIGGERVGDGAGAAQIVGGDGIGIADHLDIHHLQSALDQHGLSSDTEDKPEVEKKFHFGKLALPGADPRQKPLQKQNAPVRKSGPMRLGKFLQ